MRSKVVIEQEAAEARRMAGLLDVARVDLVKVCNALEIKFSQVPGLVPAGQAYLDQGKRVIRVDKNLKSDVKRFTFAHEIGHILMHVGMGFVHGDEVAEYEADSFAAALLFNNDHFLEDLALSPTSVPFDNVIRLAKKYGASIEATANHYCEKHYGYMAHVIASFSDGLAPTVKYVSCSETFKTLGLRLHKGMQVPSASNLASQFATRRIFGSRISPEIWFPGQGLLGRFNVLEFPRILRGIGKGYSVIYLEAIA